MTDFATLESCTELTAEHAKLAASSSVGMRNLLTRVAAIAKPGEGAPKVLMAVARLVGQDWVEGELRVELSGDESSTTIIIMSNFGAGIRERLMPTFRFAVPIDEFGRALELAPKMVLPLRISEHEGLIILTPLAKGEPGASIPVPKLSVDEASLGNDERATSPPPADELQVVDEASTSDGNQTKPPPGGPAIQPELDDPFADEIPLLGDDGAGAAPEHEGRMVSGSVAKAKPDGAPPTVHTRPTVRRMVAVDAAAIAALKRHDPRREEE